MIALQFRRRMVNVVKWISNNKDGANHVKLGPFYRATGHEHNETIGVVMSDGR